MGLGSRVQGLGFTVLGLGCRVRNLITPLIPPMNLQAGLGVLGCGDYSIRALDASINAKPAPKS